MQHSWWLSCAAWMRGALTASKGGVSVALRAIEASGEGRGWCSTLVVVPSALASDGIVFSVNSRLSTSRAAAAHSWQRRASESVDVVDRSRTPPLDPRAPQTMGGAAHWCRPRSERAIKLAVCSVSQRGAARGRRAPWSSQQTQSSAPPVALARAPGIAASRMARMTATVVQPGAMRHAGAVPHRLRRADIARSSGQACTWRETTKSLWSLHRGPACGSHCEVPG